MASVIRHRTIVEDSWQPLEADPWLRVGESGLVPDFPVAGDLLVPLRLWQLRRDDLIARDGRLGLLIEGWDEPENFADALPRLQLVAIHVPQFADGRAYSLARILRQRHGYAGELRAFGDVLRDQLLYLSRCGFDSFALRDPGRAEESLAAFCELAAALRRPYAWQRAA